MTRLSIAATTALALIGALAIAPQARAVDCDECANLPKVYRMLLDQEFLRDRFEKKVRDSFEPLSIEMLQHNAVDALNAAILDKSLYGLLQPATKLLPTAAPEYGTDLTDRTCSLKKLSTDAKGGEVRTPATPADVRQSLCTANAEFTLTHEGVHQASCRAHYAAGTQAELSTAQFYMKDDAAAYRAGVDVLREYIAKLSKSCGWVGSIRDQKPDGSKTVPTPKDVLDLAHNVKTTASALKRSSQ